ncbi:MAG TPA: serine protease [Candidatus Paceibacterota bacterium]|nr:serine protease [Candidatus Paceibacterota bacterium]
MITFIQHVIVTILIGYLGITQSIATFIDSVVGSASHETTPSVSETSSALERITSIADKYASVTQRVLLENREFQRAATIASTYDEYTDSNLLNIPTDTLIRNALVNVFCQYKTDTFIRTTTGSGFIINPKGIILTNAHVAQFLLLEGTDNVVHDTECVIRTGNPATPTYHAELLYISPTWIFENASLIDDEDPQGTGERDYALLYISRSFDKQPLPTAFHYLPPDPELLPRSTAGIEVLSAGYPAGKLLKNGPEVKLKPVIAENTIGTLYTFGSNYADIFSVSGSAVGEQGASGGPVVTQNKKAIGLIVTKGSLDEGDDSLRALTLSYIDRTIREETGFSLTENMHGDVALRGHIFKKAIGPFLSGLLEAELRE